jgi:tetratricopeptide (TPR) repeat protein
MTRFIQLIRPAIALLLLALATLPLHANEDADARYNELLETLTQSQSQSEADIIANQIWEHWLTAPDEAAQAVLDAAMERRAAYDFRGAIAETDRLIKNYPDYAEGWNQRATLYFLVGDYEASLADVAQVLAREPRHFGALAGKAMILFQQGKLPLAQIAVREALKVHPFLRERSILGANTGTEL